MGSSIENALGQILTAAGLGDAHEQAQEASKDPLVETLTAINPLFGLALGSYEGITKSSSVSNPLFRNGDLLSGTEPKLLKVDQDQWPTDAAGLIALGQDYMNMGESFWAMEAFRKAAIADPENHDAPLSLSQVYIEQGRGYEAEETLTAYINENPKDADARELRAQANTVILADLDPESQDAADTQKKILQDEAMSIALDGDDQEKKLETLKDDLLNNTPGSPEDSRQILEGLNLLAQRFSSLSAVEFDDPKDAELVGEELGYLSSKTYATMEAFCYASPYEDVHARAPLYAAMSSLANGEIDSAKSQLTDIRKDFPEADAILSEMEIQDRFAKQMAIVDVWETGVAEHKQFDPLGETYDVDFRLIPRVRQMLIDGEAETPWKALEIIAKGDEYGFKGDDEKRAEQILEIGPGNYYTRGGWSIEHFLSVSSKENPSKEEVESVIDDMDYWVAGENKAVQYPGRVFSYLEDHTNGELLDQVKGEHAKLGQERSGFLDFLKNDVSSDGFVLAVGEIACAEFFIGAGAIAATATEAKLVEMGVSRGTSMVLSQLARVGTIAGLYTARGLAEESLSKDLDQVFSPKHILLSYGANLVMVGGAEGFSALGKGAGFRISKAMGLIAEDGKTLTIGGETLAWGLTHTGGGIGVVGAGTFNRGVGLAPSSDESFSRTGSRDLFGYVKYAIGGALFHTSCPKTDSLIIEENHDLAPSLSGVPLDPEVTRQLKPTLKIEVETRPTGDGTTTDAPVPAFAAARQGKPANVEKVAPTDTAGTPEADDVVTAVKAIGEEFLKAVESEADANDANLDAAVREAREQRFADLSYQVMTVEANKTLGALNEKGLNDTVNALASRGDVLGEQAKAFQTEAKSCADTLKEFQTRNEAYQKSPTPENRADVEKFWDEQAGPAVAKLKETPQYKLLEAYQKRVDGAYLGVKGILFKTGSKVSFKPLQDLALDPQDPVGSLQKIPASELLILDSATPGKTPAKTSGSSIVPKDAMFSVGGPAGLFAILTQAGVSTPVATLLSGASLVLTSGILGMVLSGGKGGTPLKAPTNGEPVTVGRTPDNDIVIKNSAISGRHMELRAIEDGDGYSLLLTDGAYDSETRSTNGVLVNGETMQGKHQWVKPGDVISLGVESFVVQAPEKAPAQAASRIGAIPTMDWNDAKEDMGSIAAGTNKGINYKGSANEDRYAAVRLADGSTVLMAIDGMGGHGGGDRAAEAARVAMQKAAEEGKSADDILKAGHDAVVADNTAQGFRGDKAPGAVAMVVSTKPLGNGKYETHFSQIGDADAVVIRPNAADPVVFHTTRANPLTMAFAQVDGKPMATTPDGRLQRGQTLTLRLDPHANLVDGNLGASIENAWSGSPEQPLEKGDVILAGSDGFFENFGSLDLIARIVKTSGAQTSTEIRDVLMQEALIRQSLLSRASGRSINPDDYKAAYREVTGQEAPAGWRGMYEAYTDGNGLWHSYTIEGGGAVRENIYQNSRVVSSEVVDHFKKDNVALITQVLE